MTHRFSGYQLLVGGLAPKAAGYAVSVKNRAVWMSLLIGGCAAGLAGASEAAGPLGQLQRSVTTGYGYSAIIVAYLGGLNPIGIIFSAFFMSVLYIGGDNCHGLGRPAGGRRLGVPGPAAVLLSRCHHLYPLPRDHQRKAGQEPLMNGLEYILAGMLAAATPLLLAALGEWWSNARAFSISASRG